MNNCYTLSDPEDIPGDIPEDVSAGSGRYKHAKPYPWTFRGSFDRITINDHGQIGRDRPRPSASTAEQPFSWYPRWKWDRGRPDVDLRLNGYIRAITNHDVNVKEPVP
jgi:hypothetical protein